ncbi:hypothetical protein FRB97_005339 [Tulasnella sp. 331]|nr:hypothetical protein FRB97_005339 [Tulasnella sp. 331]
MDLKAKISNLFSQTDSGAGGRKQVANSLDGLVDSLPGGVVQLLALLIQDTGGLFELVLTTPSQTVERMHVELLDSRRWAAFSLEEVSLRKILVRLRNTLAALPPSSHRPENLARQGVLLDNTIAVLDAVRRLKLEENTRPELRHKKGTTNNTRPPPRIEIIEQIFVAAHSKIPETPDQARRLIATMRERLLHILKAYIGALQYPDVAKHVRTLHSSTSLLNGEGISTKDDIDSQSYWNRPIFPVGSLATLALEGQLPYAADGLELGEWPVVMSHRVFRRLCQISSEDANTFSIVLRKISELSQGLFSDTNHVRIRDNGVAIFKALLFGDQRLIYQIDIGAPVALGKYESQFPRATVGEDLEDEPVEPLKLDEKQYLELHRILATEKFIRLSQASLNIVVSDEPHKEDLDMAFAVSPQEHDIICHESSSLVLGRGGTGKTSTMLLKMLLLERAENNLDRPIRQVFITQSPSLVNKVEAYYKKLVHSSSGSSAERGTRETDVVTDLLLRSMDQELIKDKLPPGTKFGDLDDSHFPLFVTFNEFYKLLESEYNLHERETPLSFDYFVAEIWPRLNEQTKKGLHPALLFSEFMGVIKGSSNTLTAGYLDRETYESLSSRTYSTFNDDRGRIYTLFEAYRKLKPAQLVDAADRPQFDYIYIDEIQDNMLIDAAVLNLVCRNPHGLFYAGDTAQTISVGSSFRFKDLKRFLYQVEHTEPLVVAGKRRPVNPTFFELSVNYRSHAGIINLAAFIVSLISHAFPNAIDMLRREKALAPGPKPVFFLGRTDEEALTRLLSESDHNDAIELGAGQVVVVRNEEVRAALRQRLGGSVLIMTLYETKGLEFNDVVLYNFFADSMASPSNWRALSSVTRDASTSSSSSAGRFQEHQHRILQSELKSLYVAVTRAREHVWVWDESEKGEDFVTFLLQRNYIELHERYATVPRIAVKTSTREWGMQGRELFRKRLYTEASTSFRKAQLPWLQQVSEVYADRETVRKLPSVTVGRRSRFQQLGDRFGNLAATARNLNDAQDIYTQAARCYVDAAEDARAAEMFLLAAKYTDATWHYRLAGRLDDAIHVVLEYGEHVCQEVKETVTYLAKVAYTKQSETKKALSLFPKIKDYVEFLHDHGFEKQAILVLEEDTAYDEAAEVCIASGQYAKAVDLLLRCKTDTATRRAASCLLDALRKEMPFGTEIQTRGANVAGLLELMRKLNLQIDERQEMDLFHALYRGQPADLFDLNHRYRYSGKYLRWDLLAFDGYLRDVRTLISSQTSTVNLIGVLEAIIEYGRLVRGIARIHDIVGEEDLHHVFGISPTAVLLSTHAPSPGPLADDAPLIRVLPTSPMYTDALNVASTLTAAPGFNGSGSSAVLPRHIVNALIREYLLVRLNGMLFCLHTHLKDLGRLQVCLVYALKGHCNRAADGQSCELFHSETRHESAEAFNERFRVHLLIITALENFTAVERRKGATREDISLRKFYQRYWLARLFQVCYPATLSMGNITHVIPAAIPKFNSLMAIARQWIQEVLCDHSPRSLSQHTLSDMLMASILAAHFDFQVAQHYTHRSYINFDNYIRTGHDHHRLIANAIQNSLKYLFRREPRGWNTSYHTLR